MALKWIIDADRVIERMALQNISEVVTAVEAALNTAHAVLQGMLHTVFEPTATARSDTFYLDANRYPGTADNLSCCKLAQAFVWASDVSITSNVESRKALNSSPSTVEAENYLLDPLRGYVFIENDYLGSWVKITYKAGFDATHKSPDWLQEAVLAYLPHLLVQPSGAMDTAAMTAATEAEKMAWNVTAKIIEPFLRNRAMQFTPYGV